MTRLSTNEDAAEAALCGRADELGAEVTAPLARVEEFMASYIRSQDLPANLREATEYALLGGGKRLRPLLTLHSCRAVGGADDDCLPGAAGVEMIHAFSLVHDDLPALDDDDLRRGRPTVHVAHGEALAVLVGDGLMSMAFGVLAKSDSPDWLSGRLAAELATGTTNMISGQVLDTLGGFSDGLSDEAKVGLIHRNKTGALIRASCRMGALSALAKRESFDDEALESITRFADAIGLMFQIIDDLLDVEQTTEHLGKRSSKDSEAGKLTFPGVLGVARSKQEVERLQGTALESIRAFGERGAGLEALTHYLSTRTR